MTPSCTVVVPCFNEAARLDPAQLDALAVAADARVLAVDDGSTDDTAALLDKLVGSDPDRYQMLSLGPNRGKGEAVRQGMLAAVASGADLVAYCDADFATPPDEVARVVAALRADDGVGVVLGSRVALMGSDIRRSAYRHYTGRLFATAGSLVLGVPVYDTQCGAKAFRVTDALRQALASPFMSRWAFDVELLGRLLRQAGDDPSAAAGPGPGRFVELPLRRWSEPGGSKLTSGAGLRAAVDLMRIRRLLRPARRSADRLDEQRHRA
jgi:glycosyltransferase involved in cell wall biosynthesis